MLHCLGGLLPGYVFNGIVERSLWINLPKANIEPDGMELGKMCSFTTQWFSGSMFILRGVHEEVC